MRLVAGVAAIVMSLVGVLYSLLRQTDTKQQDQLDDGADQFSNNAVEIERIKKDIASIRDWVKDIEESVNAVEGERLKDHESVLLIKDHHKRNHGEEVK